MTKKNQQHIDVLERDIHRVEMRIQGEQRNTPPASEVPAIQNQLSILQGMFKAVDRAFQEVSRERAQLQQEEFQRRMREQAKYKQQDPGLVAREGFTSITNGIILNPLRILFIFFAVIDSAEREQWPVILGPRSRCLVDCLYWGGSNRLN